MSENMESHVGESEPTPSGRQAGSPSTTRGLSNGVRVALVVALVLLIGIGLFAAWQIGRNSASGAGTTTSQTEQSAAAFNALPEAVAATFRQSVVQIDVVTKQGAGLGSGTIIDSRGYIVTNEHVVAGATQIEVELYDGQTVPAQLTGLYVPEDLAVIKIASCATYGSRDNWGFIAAQSRRVCNGHWQSAGHHSNSDLRYRQCVRKKRPGGTRCGAY